LSQHRKSRFLTLITAILIVSGLLLVSAPYLQSFYQDVLKVPKTEQPSISSTSNPNDTNHEDSSPATEQENNKTIYDTPGNLPEGATGVLEIPKLNLKLNVLYGVTPSVLKQGIGFYPQSEEPGLGNTCIAGHRNAYGSPFWHLDKLQPGDEIILYYNNRAFYYRVSLNYITHSRDWSVIADTDDAVITLTTCDYKR
jgi:sortase A